MRSDFGHASAPRAFDGVGMVLSAIIGAIRGWCIIRPRLRFGLDSRVGTSERRWIVTSISKRVLNAGNRVLKCQLSCQNGRRPMKTNADNGYFAPPILSVS